MRISILVFVFLTSYCISSAETITGLVIDSLSKNPLTGATIRIVGSTYGDKSEAAGTFSIKNIPPGKYVLSVSYVGYATRKIPIVISKSMQETKLIISLVQQDVNSSEIVVSAGKRSQTIQEVPVSISLLDQQSIQQRNINKIDEALRYVPGVNVARDQVSIRGSSGFALGIGSRVALLLDGFPMLSADNGDMKFDALPMMEINRVEVIKGAGSALYGTGALGGVVSMFTRVPVDTARIIVRTYAGLYTQPKFDQWIVYDNPPGLYGIDASYSQKIEKLELTLNGGTRFDQSYRLSDESRRYNAFVKLGYTFNEAGTSKISTMFNLANEDRGDWVYWNSLDSATRPPSNSNMNRKTHSQKIAAAIDFKHFCSESSFLQIRTGLFSTHFENSGLIAGEEQIASSAISYNSEMQYSTSLMEGLFFTSGINIISNVVDAPIYGLKKQQYISGYVQGEIKPGIEGLIFTVGGRIDKEQTENTESNLVMSPKIAGSWLTPFGMQLRASIGRGFRAATVAERYAALRFQGISVIPNLSIKPEYSTSYEIGVSSALPLSDNADMLFFDCAYFNNSLDDLVEPSFNSSAKVIFQNVTKARVQGFELTMRAMLSQGMTLEASCTYMDPVDLTKNTTLSYRSRLLFYSRLSLPISDVISYQIDYRHISRTDNIDERLVALNAIADADARVPINVCDMRIIANMNALLSFPLTLTLNAKNVFDYYYSEIMGNLAPVRQLSLQAEILL